MFLTPADLAELTGYKRPHKQIEWLRRSGLRFWVNGCGLPVVPRAAIEESAKSGQTHGPQLRLA